jgi:hypothetical protein
MIHPMSIQVLLTTTFEPLVRKLSASLDLSTLFRTKN